MSEPNNKKMPTFLKWKLKINMMLIRVYRVYEIKLHLWYGHMHDKYKEWSIRHNSNKEKSKKK